MKLNLSQFNDTFYLMPWAWELMAQEIEHARLSGGKPDAEGVVTVHAGMLSHRGNFLEYWNELNSAKGRVN